MLHGGYCFEVTESGRFVQKYSTKCYNKMGITLPDHPRLAYSKRGKSYEILVREVGKGNLVAGAGIEPATFGL